jgi:NAD(P)-dependent dehydrogenase (short-subunit alcohol dehydrogenase family)
LRLSGKIAIVTGATRGIGRACALALAREGADVLVSGRDVEAGGGACAEIAALGRRATFHAADLSQANAARGVVDAALTEFGVLDVLVNNAGIFERAPVLDLEEDAWDRVLNVNLKGAYFCAQAAPARPCVACRFRWDAMARPTKSPQRSCSSRRRKRVT